VVGWVVGFSNILDFSTQLIGRFASRDVRNCARPEEAILTAGSSWYRDFLEQLIITQPDKKFPAFMKPERSNSCSQKPNHAKPVNISVLYYLRFILTASSHLYQCCLFLSVKAKLSLRFN
jgi:hypothetical protein